MNRTALTNIAPDIFRKRLLVEGYFRSDMSEVFCGIIPVHHQ